MNCIFPGSFDPFSYGHHDIVVRGLELFDSIVIAMGVNGEKKPYFDPSSVVAAVESVFADEPRVRIIQYQELTAHVAKRHRAVFLLRGVRNTTDFEFENSLAQLNKHLYASLETVFLITSPQYAAISASLIREAHKYGGTIDPFLPYDPNLLKVLP